MLRLSVRFCSVCILLTAVIADVQVLVPDNTYAVLADNGGAGGRQTSLSGGVLSDTQDASGDPENRLTGSIDSDQRSDSNAIRSSLSVAGSATTSIQHHILPPETIPLPLTISARPGLRTVIAPETITIHEPTVAKVGEVVHKIPTAVSHQSQTVVHKHADVVTPIIAPAVRTISSQVVRAYHTPLVYAAQVPVVVQS